MKVLSLFSGIGGIDLAGEWAGIETIAFCEQNDFCQQVLKNHWANVPIYDDVCKLTKEDLERDGIDCGTIDLIHGGEPCQPYSFAGKREGEGDDRHLWKEVKRLLETIRPRWYLRENVVGNVSLGIDQTLSDLENIGYATRTFDIPACAVKADSERRRIFIIAHSKREGQQGSWGCIESLHTAKNPHRKTSGIVHAFQGNTLPYVCREHNGIPRKLDENRLTALGNAVDPHQVYPILAAIKQINDIRK